MNRRYELRLLRATRPEDSRTRPAKVIQLESRRAQRIERIQRLTRTPSRPDAA